MRVTRKKCRTCGITKSIGDFNRHNSYKDGHLNQCKACVAKQYSNHRSAQIRKWLHGMPAIWSACLAPDGF